MKILNTTIAVSVDLNGGSELEAIIKAQEYLWKELENGDCLGYVGFYKDDTDSALVKFALEF